MSAQTQFDISTRITGYQSTLKQLQQAIQQLDPGASIRKSLQAAFKNAEAYINKLAKNPIVNVGSEKQLQSLINTLDKASSMISGIADRFKEVEFSDLNAEVLKEALDGINQQLSETTQKLNQVSNGPQLSTLAGKVKNLDTVFSGLGKNINDLGAIEGVNVLNEALEESKSRAEQARAALDDVQKRINAWKPPEDTTGLFGNKSGGKGTKLLKQLDTSSVFKNIDFDKAGFSQQAIEKLKINLTEQLKASLDSNYLKEGVAENIQTALDSAFNQGLNAGNLSDRIGQFADNIRAMLGKKASEMGDIYNMIFGGDVGSKKSGTRVADNLLRQVTIEMNAGAERLRQIIEVVSNAKLAEDKPLIKLVEAGQFENVKQQLEDILQTAKQAYVEMRQLPSGLSEERTNAQARLAAANSDINNISTVQQQIINTQEYQQAIAKIQQLETEVTELRTALSELQAQKVSTIHEMADDVDKAGQSYRITTEQAEQYRNKLDEIQSKEKLLGKIQGVVERWFSIYAAVRLVSNAVRSMISTVEELDKTITNIAIVTSMSQNDLWQQMPVYTKTAREFAASISGVYEVSQLYYYI